MIMLAVLVDDAADRSRIKSARNAIEHNLRDSCLTLLGFAARFKIDCFGKATLFSRIVLVDHCRAIWPRRCVTPASGGEPARVSWQCDDFDGCGIRRSGRH